MCNRYHVKVWRSLTNTAACMTKYQRALNLPYLASSWLVSLVEVLATYLYFDPHWNVLGQNHKGSKAIIWLTWVGMQDENKYMLPLDPLVTLATTWSTWLVEVSINIILEEISLCTVLNKFLPDEIPSPHTHTHPHLVHCIQYSSNFLWHNIFVNFVIDPSFANFFSYENLIFGGVAFHEQSVWCIEH